ncbi:MAG: hypothetical protein U1F66_12675 [bacterium]
MSRRNRWARFATCLFLLLLGLAGCGHGGTEIGNPTVPTAGSPSGGGENGPASAPGVQDASPTPSPQSFLIKGSQEEDEAPEEPGALLDNPEENS